MPSSALPNPWYYLDNFQFVLRWVAQRYTGLLSPAERAFIDDFLALERPSRALLVRMIMRKGSLFRAGKLHYAEIGSVSLAIAPLLALGWVQDQPEIPLEDLFRLLTRAETSQLFEPLLAWQGLKAATKSAQLKHLLADNPSARTLAGWQAYAAAPAGAWPAHPASGSPPPGGSATPPAPLLQEPLYQTHVLALCDRLRLMFFGNLRQDWSEFVLADLGLYTYESVQFPDSARAFFTRQEIDDYLHLHQCREALDTAQDDAARDNALNAIPAQPYSSGWLESRRARLLFHAGQHCERQASWARARDCYAASADRNARARHIRMLERLEQYPQALALARASLKQPGSEAEQQAVLRMLPRLLKRCGQTVPRRTGQAPAQLIRLDLPAPPLPTRIEEEARRHLDQPDAPAYYVENTLFNSLFGLLCWPAVFASVPGAFFHPFQHGPADLLHSSFLQQRRPLFDDCLAQLGNNSYQQTILRNFRDKHGLQSPFVAWSALSPELLALALACIPASHLHALFSRLLSDIRENRYGLPDLIQFWPNESRYRLIEIKGPGDRLQDNQIRWLAYCNTHGIDAQVCHVQRPVPS